MAPKRNKVKGGIERKLISVVAALSLFGLLFVYDSTVVYSHEIYGDPYRFVLLQLGWLVLGLLFFLAFYKINYKKIVKLSYFLFFTSLALLVFLAVASLLPCGLSLPFAPCLNGANRWILLNPYPLPKIPLLGVLGFQPSEMAKLALIMYLAVQLMRHKENYKDAFLVTIVAAGVASLLILLQPNMSTAIIVLLIAIAMYFSSGASLKPLLVTIPLLMIVVFVVLLVSPYRRQRLFTFFSSAKEESGAYHIDQVLISLGSGGLFGTGLGQSKQKYHYLPEVASDSIFALVGEEVGFVGTTILLSGLTYLLYIGFKISRFSDDPLGKLLAVGITSWFGIQIFMNVAAMTGLMPLTGVPLPLVSYGGSSMLFSMMALGLLVNIAHNIDKEI